MKESYIESYLVRKVKEHGGLCYKFVSPGNPGVPDRLIITPTGKTIFVELFGMDAVKDFLREVFPA